MLPCKNWIHLSKWSQPELCYCSHWGVRGKPHEPALLGSRLGGQSHTNSLCQISLLVLFCLSGIHSVFPPLFSSRKYSAWNWTFCEMAMVLTRKAIIYKIRVKSVKMDWLEKNVLWLDIRMSEYLLQCDCHLLFIRKLQETHIKKEYVFILCFFSCLPWVSGITAATQNHDPSCLLCCTMFSANSERLHSQTNPCHAREPLQREKTLYTRVLKCSLLRKKTLFS